MVSNAFHRTVAATLWSLAVMGTSPWARSEERVEQTAQTLFDDGRRLMEQSRFVEAIPKLVESQKLDPAPGTLLNLAACHEKVGRTATAWREYRQVLATTPENDAVERREIASERIASIEPSLSRVAFELPPSIPKDAWLSLDDEPLSPVEWATAIPIDPGLHRVRYGAPGRAERVVAFNAGAPGTTVTLRLAVLPPPTLVTGARPKESDEEPSWLLPGASLAIAAGGFGAMTYFGLRARGAWERRERHCVRGCDQTAVNAGASASRYARAADVSLAVGVIASGLGAVLLWRKLDAEPPSVALGVSVDRHSTMLDLRTAL